MEEKTWGVIDDSGKWKVHRVSEKRAREAYEDVNYGKLVKNILSGNRYTVVESNSSPHT